MAKRVIFLIALWAIDQIESQKTLSALECQNMIKNPLKFILMAGVSMEKKEIILITINRMAFQIPISIFLNHSLPIRNCRVEPLSQAYPVLNKDSFFNKMINKDLVHSMFLMNDFEGSKIIALPKYPNKNGLEFIYDPIDSRVSKISTHLYEDSRKKAVPLSNQGPLFGYVLIRHRYRSRLSIQIYRKFDSDKSLFGHFTEHYLCYSKKRNDLIYLEIENQQQNCFYYVELSIGKGFIGNGFVYLFNDNQMVYYFDKLALDVIGSVVQLYKIQTKNFFLCDDVQQATISPNFRIRTTHQLKFDEEIKFTTVNRNRSKIAEKPVTRIVDANSPTLISKEESNTMQYYLIAIAFTVLVCLVLIVILIIKLQSKDRRQSTAKMMLIPSKISSQIFNYLRHSKIDKWFSTDQSSSRVISSKFVKSFKPRHHSIVSSRRTRIDGNSIIANASRLFRFSPRHISGFELAQKKRSRIHSNRSKYSSNSPIARN
ncbi:cyclin-dependent kinase 20 [Sarcoptes scabiei]|nr:cyclin-dependent kinase 20 [Sarcoptes scabiei]